jgi:hypothetical protein
MSTTIRTFDDLKAHAEEHFPETFQQLPDPKLYSVDACRGYVLIQIGTLKPSQDPVWARLKCTETGSTTERSWRMHASSKIRLLSPFRWSWSPSGFDEPRLDRLQAFLRYCALSRGYCGLEEEKFDFAAVFREVCEELPWEKYTKWLNKGATIREQRRKPENARSLLTACLPMTYRKTSALCSTSQRRSNMNSAASPPTSSTSPPTSPALPPTWTDSRKNSRRIEARALEVTDVERQEAENEAEEWKGKYLNLQYQLRVLSQPDDEEH